MLAALVVPVWAQRAVSATRIAVVFSLETVFAGPSATCSTADRFGALAWTGLRAELRRIVLAEPAAATRPRR